MPTRSRPLSDLDLAVRVIQPTRKQDPVDLLLFLVDLEPFQARRGCSGSVVDLGHIIHDGPLVRWVDAYGQVIGILCSPDDVAPKGANLVTSLDVDHGAIVRAGLAAGHIGAIHVCDRIVGGRSAKTE